MRSIAIAIIDDPLLHDVVRALERIADVLADLALPLSISNPSGSRRRSVRERVAHDTTRAVICYQIRSTLLNDTTSGARSR